MSAPFFAVERGLNVTKLPCRMACGRLAWGPRGFCHHCYDAAQWELRKWRERMKDRRELLARGLNPEATKDA